MSELTDLELCKRIAEIERVDVTESDGGLWVYVKVGATCVKTLVSIYSPLTNKALLFDLMLKHKVEPEYYEPDDMVSSMVIYAKDYSLLARSEFKEECDAPRAILECIVRANQ